MSTPNPEYDPDWRIKRRAAQLRVESIGGQDNISDMFSELEKQFTTLEGYHAEILKRIRREFPDEMLSEETFPFDPAMSPDDLRAKWRAIRTASERRQWKSSVRNRKRHGQPDGLSVFADPVPADCERTIQRIRWGGRDGRRMGISETIAVCDLNAAEAHVCFLTAPSVVRGTPPESDDMQGTVRLPSIYFSTALADRYGPDRVTWYHYVTGDGSLANAWFFRRATLEWMPSRTNGFLWRRQDVPGDWFTRAESSSNDYHFRSVPRVIGEAVMLDSDSNLPIVELPDFRGW